VGPGNWSAIAVFDTLTGAVVKFGGKLRNAQVYTRLNGQLRQVRVYKKYGGQLK
jgi:hypothetical protein